ncbi:DUF4304 domain-containing protein [Micromonospora sp. DR5-3]|uniref:DUF4304 domain-containing protein n=1 Tax=unclassified Micromonospora TaxID=2617518 RepID=UPI0011DB6530|nr:MULTISPECIES: DUF4304 domain-containing protein [unclassified Micromonospora]MCW3818608.1 DUF4304 domain-containing protein [Micromonospora sp. DR5-3]TYC20062.1 DUF4304 domain-containing protein [Micromonospora sp. MP36]
MSLQPMFNAFVTALGDQLAGYGFKRGKGRVFRRYSPEGDALIIELQTSDHSTKWEKIFYINMALVLAPKWERDRQQYGLPASELPRHFHGTWRQRIGFSRLSPADDQWRIADEVTAAQVSEQVRRRLDETLPELLPLLDRDQLIERAPQILGAAAWRVRAWLLAERGPSKELEDLLFAEQPAHNHNSVPTKAIWTYANSKAAAESSGERAPGVS